ncbi:MAG TPA: ABC transporter substrate-binding protein, partial [Candidatus Nitrosotenuis sp.]|nr:ABC transporter substrate-binding protein [Candidatus Nitrosotenuis sp.]
VYGLEHLEDALDYSMQYGRGKPKSLIEKFVKMYVNDVTVDMGEPGEKSVRTFFEMAQKKNLIPDYKIQIS